MAYGRGEYACREIGRSGGNMGSSISGRLNAQATLNG